MIISIIYAIIALISLLLLGAYCRFIIEKERWFILLYISVFVVNLGYFLLSVSKSLEMALFANRISYLGSVFLPLCMLMVIIRICDIKVGKILTSILISVSIIVFFIAASQGYLDWYYKEVSIVFVNNAARLVKEYGPLHNLYYVYLLVHLLAMGGVICRTTFMKNKVIQWKHAVLLWLAVFGNTIIWFVEQLIRVDFEFLSVSYIVTELFLLFLYAIIQEYLTTGIGNAKIQVNQGIDMEKVVQQYAGLLTEREQEVFRCLIEDKKRKDIADELGVTEHTIKKHTSHIFVKFEVTNRKELFQKIGYRM